jgi:ATP-dependent RNA helicase DDX47/RRP3
VEVSSKYSTVDTLMQYYTFIPAKYKDIYLAYILNELSGNTVLVFTTTCNSALRLSLMLRNLGFLAIPIYGKMNQEKRLGALGKFKSGVRNILVATDVASRSVDLSYLSH